MMLTRCFWPSKSFATPSSSDFCTHSQVTAAEVMVIPRSRSCSMWSVVAAPSCTSPIRWIIPV